MGNTEEEQVLMPGGALGCELSVLSGIDLDTQQVGSPVSIPQKFLTPWEIIEINI